MELNALLFDFDVDAGWQIEAHQRVDRLGRWFVDVDNPLMYASFKLFSGIFVDKGRPQNGELVHFSWKWNRSPNRSA